ncbi:MAG: flagellar type III secretion system pore protein FliP [Mariprofundaceae bacterium]|nr:flagellar type III secretion system pore protein FliP [Mariprofundaceae bacterium]
MPKLKTNMRLPLFALFILSILLPQLSFAADIPTLSISLGENDDPDAWFTGLKIIASLTVLALAPSILVMMTSFTRILVVFAFLRQALGTQQSPPTQILVGLALFMTVFIMMPVWETIDQQAITPYLNEDINQAEMLERAINPLRQFMLRQTREDDLLLFLNAAKMEKPNTASDTPMHVLIPAFVISELRTAFEIGFLIYIPFVVLDLVVASVLMSMGMMMLPPVMISLPLKIILFVLVDGWHLITASLLQSFH